MSLALNGSTGYLVQQAKIVSGYPFSMAMWVAGSTSVSQQFAIMQGQSNGDRYAAGWFTNSGGSKLANYRAPGASVQATKTTTPDLSPTTMRLMIVVFESTTSRRVYFGSNTPATDSAASLDDSSNHDRVMIGGYQVNNASSPSIYLNGSVAEPHFFNRALVAADYDAMAGGTLPETLSGWVDGWTLKDYSAGGSYTSIGGTRTLTASAGVSASGLAHPITRSSGDTTAPTLSSPVGTTTSSTTATVGATTDEANGTMYAIVSTSNTAPTATQIMAGQTNTGATAPWSGNQTISSTGAKTFGATGLTASTLYYGHVMHRDTAGNNSTVVTSASFTTSSESDTTPPNLSSPTGSATGQNTANVGVTTDEANGTLYVVVTNSAAQPSIAQIKAGQNDGGTAAAYASSQAISTTGAKTFGATGLTASTTYYAHFVHTDAAANDSTRVSSTSFTTGAASDTTPPTLTSGVATQTGPTTATVGATTDEANGILYAVVTTSSTAPSAAQVLAGQTNTGASAPWAGNLTVSSTGAKTLNATGLTGATVYYAYLMHRDAAGNNSAVLSTASFTTAAYPTFVTDPIGNNTTSLYANTSGWSVDIINATTGALIVRITGLTTNSQSRLSVTSALMTTGVAVRFRAFHATYGDPLALATPA